MLADRIVTLKLPPALCVASGTSVRQVIATVQRHRVGAVLVCDAKRPIGIITERDVLMKIVARDVDYDEPVDRFMTPNPVTLTSDDSIGEALAIMNRQGIRNIPIVHRATGEAGMIFRVRDVIQNLAESFPEHVLNLPPSPHQRMTTPEGA